MTNKKVGRYTLYECKLHAMTKRGNYEYDY